MGRMAEPSIHAVKEGETLWSIAEQYEGVAYGDIVMANPALFDTRVFPNADPNFVMPGWHLIIPAPELLEPEPEPEPEPVRERVVTVDYSGAANQNGVETSDLREFWVGDIDRFNGTNSDWPGVQLRDGYTRHWHQARKRGPGIEVRAHTSNGGQRISARWEMLLEEGFTFGTTQTGGKLGGVALGGGDAHGGSGAVDGAGSVRLNWRSFDGELSIYAYHLDQPTDYGEHILTGVSIPVGTYVELGLDIDVAEGRVAAFLDGQMIHDTGPGRFRWTEGIGLSEFIQVVRFGGASHDFGPTDVCYSRFYRGHVDVLTDPA